MNNCYSLDAVSPQAHLFEHSLGSQLLMAFREVVKTLGGGAFLEGVDLCGVGLDVSSWGCSCLAAPWSTEMWASSLLLQPPQPQAVPNHNQNKSSLKVEVTTGKEFIHCQRKTICKSFTIMKGLSNRVHRKTNTIVRVSYSHISILFETGSVAHAGLTWSPVPFLQAVIQKWLERALCCLCLAKDQCTHRHWEATGLEVARGVAQW